MRNETPTPATIRAQRIKAMLVAAVCKITPAIHQNDAIYKPLIPIILSAGWS